MAKLYDLAVVTGSYTNQAGEEKKRWKNIGSVLETKDGGKVILIDRTFNPAGIDVEPGRDSIMISMFAPKENEANKASQPSAAPQQPRAAQKFGDFEDSIPF